MQIIKQENLNVDEVVEILKQGKIIVYPTETVYGLGCDATNQEAVDKVFKIKQRQQNKPLLMVVNDVNMITEYVDWNEKLEELGQKYWPGALTVVTQAKSDCNLVRGVLAEDGTVAFRITEHHLASEITEKLDKPLVSTSANITAQESSYDVESVVRMFENQEFQPDIIIDVGELPHRSPSTIVRVTGDRVEVLRQGELIIE
jgi:L-threonylcarbamoyladenylate synthase